MITTKETPRIYVACLSSYNNGILHGTWIDCELGQDFIEDSISKMLSESIVFPHEEWAIHDSEGFGELKLSEYESIETIAELANIISEHGDAFSIYANHVGIEYATIEGFQESYQGEYASEEFFAEEYLDMTAEIPEWIEPYFDYAKYANSLFYGGDYWSHEVGYNEVHVFLYT